jgi:hypothetical protein
VAAPGVNLPNATLTGRGERMRAGGPVERDVGRLAFSERARLRFAVQSCARCSLPSARHHFEERATIGRGALVLRACAIQDVRARSARAVVIYECAGKNVQVFVVFVVFNDAHPVARIPLDQHRHCPVAAFS